MNILGIETSCDETAAAVVADGRKILSNVVASQISTHARFGGVIPEVAAREHIEAMLPVITAALDGAFPGKTETEKWQSIDGIAVTSGPGLLGSLLIGTQSAATLAYVKDKPLYACDHVWAHAYAAWLSDESMTQDAEPAFPLLALIVSGGHTQLVLFKDYLVYEVLGQTGDDAAGEAFDKVAKLLGLEYPGGPAIAVAAESGNEAAYAFPAPKLASYYDFSFSGLKTAVLRQVQSLAGLDFRAPSAGLADKLSRQQICDVAASFQRTVINILIKAIERAAQEYRPKTITITGGVAANKLLKQVAQQKFSQTYDLRIPPPHLCTDNAAMIASLGYRLAKANQPTSPLELKANPIQSM